jgi:ATP phosphoribosyltransferase regulatory subunit HisZ
MIFELVVPTPDGPVEVCGGGRYDGLARVLGSDRDDRGAGFAFGLERLLVVLDTLVGPPPSAPRGVLVVNHAGYAGAVGYARMLREIAIRAIVETDQFRDRALERFDDDVQGLARRLQLSHVLTRFGPPGRGEEMHLLDLATGEVAEINKETFPRTMRCLMFPDLDEDLMPRAKGARP